MSTPQPATEAQIAWLVNLLRRSAAAEIMPRFGRLADAEIGTKTGPHDLVTEADRAAEAMLTRALVAAFPEAQVVGEETAESAAAGSAILAKAALGFVLDPVDGTWNFAHGVPAFGSMLALCRDGHPVLGLILDPITGDVACGGLEVPARLMRRLGADQPLRTAAPKPLEALKGYMEPFLLPPGVREAVVARSMQFTEVSSLRCSAYHYRLLAQGAVDFSLAGALSPWDHLPGASIVRAAGGYVAMTDGRPYEAGCTQGYLLSASSREVWECVRDHLAPDLPDVPAQAGS